MRVFAASLSVFRCGKRIHLHERVLTCSQILAEPTLRVFGACTQSCMSLFCTSAFRAILGPLQSTAMPSRPYFMAAMQSTCQAQHQKAEAYVGCVCKTRMREMKCTFWTVRESKVVQRLWLVLFHSRNHRLTCVFQMQSKLSLDLDIRVLESSRPASAGARKLSYHVIGTNLAFEDCSKNGPLYAYVTDFLDTNAEDKAFFWPDNSERSIVDMSVYSRNRVLRTPLSFKLDDATKTPLLLLPPWNGQNEIEEAFVTNLTLCGPGLRILTMQDISSIIPAKATMNICFPQLGGMKKREGASTSSVGKGRSNSSHAAQAGGPSVCPTVSVKELQVMLDAAGSEGCKVLGQLPDPSKKDGTTNFECRNLGKRKCLVCEGELHEKTNASLNVDRDGNVRYWCFAEDCHKRGPVLIRHLAQGLGGALPSAYASGSVATPFRAKLDLDAAPNVALEADHGATSKMEVDRGATSKMEVDSGATSKMEVDHKATTAEEEADHEAPSAMEIDYEAASSSVRWW